MTVLVSDEYRKRLESLRRFLAKRGRKRPTDVSADDLDQLMLDMLDRGTRKATRRSLASTARSFFAWLAEEGRILSDPAKDIPVPDDDQVDLLVPPLEEEQVAEILDNLPRRDVIDFRNRLHLELLYGCGLRIKESVDLNLRDVSLTRRTVHVKSGKGGKERILPMMRGVQGALKDYLVLRRSVLRGPDHGALLLSRRGDRLNPSTFRTFLRMLNRKRGQKARRVFPHLFRHSIACHLLRGGADIRHIQEFLGHSSLDTTKTYLRLVPGRLKEDYEKAMPEVALTL